MSGKTELNDLRLLVQSKSPIITIETHEEKRALELITQLAIHFNKPVFDWDRVDGLQRSDVTLDLAEIEGSKEPLQALTHIKSVKRPAIFILCDFHPYLQDGPKIVRLIKEIALNYPQISHTLIFVSHQINLPAEIKRYSARFQLALPSEEQLEDLVREEAKSWSKSNRGQKVTTDSETLKKLVRNLKGMSKGDARTLIRNVISDGAITEEELPALNKAKFELLDMDGVLSFEYETSKFSEVGGLANLKNWLKQRKAVFLDQNIPLDPPKGLMLLGIQGGGKSLAAKAVAGAWGLPLLRLDFGTLYNKYHGETEKNLRLSLKMAEQMAPCVLWFDEIEKGLSSGESDGGTSQRLLATLLTWMAENTTQVFIVATANDISRLPPELMRKGRMDEIFFVDLPDHQARMDIFKIHLEKRKQTLTDFDLSKLADVSDGFTGSEIEQAVVSSLYRAYGGGSPMNTITVSETVKDTRPISVVMSEKIQALRDWAKERTVLAN
ncbi:MAG: AAA family ATPase [Enterobacterales bacterium]|nr:AAA family ATPase [Enterobacterales bacterium]